MQHKTTINKLKCTVILLIAYMLTSFGTPTLAETYKSVEYKGITQYDKECVTQLLDSLDPASFRVYENSEYIKYSLISKYTKDEHKIFFVVAYKDSNGDIQSAGYGIVCTGDLQT